MEKRKKSGTVLNINLYCQHQLEIGMAETDKYKIRIHLSASLPAPSHMADTGYSTCNNTIT